MWVRPLRQASLPSLGRHRQSLFFGVPGAVYITSALRAFNMTVSGPPSSVSDEHVSVPEVGEPAATTNATTVGCLGSIGSVEDEVV